MWCLWTEVKCFLTSRERNWNLLIKKSQVWLGHVSDSIWERASTQHRHHGPNRIFCMCAIGHWSLHSPVCCESHQLESLKAKDVTDRERQKRAEFQGLAHSWCTMLSVWLTDTAPSCLNLCHWKVVLREPTSSSSFSCSLANSMKTCKTCTYTYMWFTGRQEDMR